MTHQTTAVTKEDVTQVKHQRKETESNMKPQQKVDKTFEELVEESIRLPELNASSCLPMTMTEILRSSKKEKDVTTKLPKIHSGQVQLVTMGDGFSSERKRRRGKKVKAHRRPETPSPRAAPRAPIARRSRRSPTPPQSSRGTAAPEPVRRADHSPG